MELVVPCSGVRNRQYVRMIFLCNRQFNSVDSESIQGTAYALVAGVGSRVITSRLAQADITAMQLDVVIPLLAQILRVHRYQKIIEYAMTGVAK